MAKAESYFLTPARSQDEAAKFVATINRTTRSIAGDDLLYTTPAAAIEGNRQAGMPDDYAFEIYRVTVEKVETTL